MVKRFRILLLIPHLGGGGAEQVITQLAQRLNPAKYDLHLGLITQTAPQDNSIPDWVTVHALNAARVRSASLPLLKMVQALSPDLILSGIAHLNFLVLLLKPFFPRKTRILVRQNATVSAAIHYGGLPPYTRTLYRLLYRHADRIICQTQSMADDLREVLGTNSTLAVLPNPVDVDAVRRAMCGPILWPSSGPNLLAVGRLSPEKGFDRLLEAMKLVRLQFPTARLVILGTGPEQERLEAIRQRMGLNDAVNFMGYVNPAWVWFPGADLFVLSSHHEGMPNALLEAAAAGLPLVSTAASGGIVELLTGRAQAWLCTDASAEGLSQAIQTALRAVYKSATKV